MTLEILICTLGEGIFNVTNVILPPLENIKYLISWQIPDGYKTVTLPIGLLRDDIKIVQQQGVGLSRNRNNAILNATADICLIADDDVKYTSSQLYAVIETFESNEKIDLATFKSGGISVNKYFPPKMFDLRQMPRNYYVNSIEIAFRRTKIQDIVAFNEHFGLGAPVLSSGEEEIFILDALDKNINATYIPIEIVTHNGDTTAITRRSSPGVLMARGAYISRRFPSLKYLRIMKIAWREKQHNGIGFWKSAYYMVKGISYARKIKLI